MNQRKPRNFWTEENVIASARHFGTISEWRKHGSGAYGKASEMGWLQEATGHMEKKYHDWNYEAVKEEAHKYTTLSSWAKNGKGSYSKAQKMGWLDELSSFFVRQIHPNGYWTKERVFTDAMQYKSRSEWRKKSSAATTIADKNGWFDEAVKHMPLLIEHGKWTKESVIESAKKYNHIVDWQENFPGAYGKALKRKWLHQATNHMTPSPRVTKWTKEEVLADAKRYNTKGEWHKAPGNAAHVAIKNGWHEEATKHMHQVLSFGELTIYKMLLQLDVQFETQKRFKFIKDKKPLPFDFYLPQFNLVVEYQGIQHFTEAFRKDNETLNDRQRRDELKRNSAEQNAINYLAISSTLESDIESLLINKLISLSVVIKKDFQPDKRQLTFEELELLKTLGTWTKEQVIADARKYKTYPEWRKGSPAYQIAIKNGWLDVCKEHMQSEFETRSKAKLIWTKEKIIEAAKPFSSRSAFKASFPAAYTRARLHGWIDEVCLHMVRKIRPNGYWTKERIFDSAKKYQARNDWQKSEDKTAYTVARENGWLEDACSHMTLNNGWDKRAKKKVS
jgi:hypothetical protein